MKIYSTKDYGQFKYFHDNRDIDQNHVNKLVRKIKERNLLIDRPILVNHKMQVLDGQHRLEAAKIADVPVYYVFAQTMTREDISIMSSTNKNWTGMDFLVHHMKNGNKAAKVFLEFMEQYGFKSDCATTLLCGGVRGSEQYKRMREGSIKIKNIEKAHKVANWSMELKNYFPEGYKQRFLILALYRLADLKQFKWDYFMKKVKYLSSRLHKCVSADEYVTMIEEIYNYKSKSHVFFHAEMGKIVEQERAA